MSLIGPITLPKRPDYLINVLMKKNQSLEKEFLGLSLVKITMMACFRQKKATFERKLLV